MSKEHKGHVHFGEGDEVFQQKENTILVESKVTGSIDIHLGFLQFQHHYEITVEVPKKAFLENDLKNVLRAAETSSPNVNCKLLSVSEMEENFILVVEFFAYKEKLLKEIIIFTFDESSTSIVITFMARVLGRGKGTPLLKYGIKCIGVEADELSEASDWHGFD